MARATASWSFVVSRSPEEVFAYLADVRRHAEWSPKSYRIEGLADGPIGRGTTFTSYGWVPRDADHRNDVEVTEYGPSSLLTFTSIDHGEPFVNRYRLSPSGSGTRVERTMEMPRPTGARGVLFPLVLAAVIKPGVGKGMGMLKANLESSE